MNSISAVIASYLINAVWQTTLVAGAGWLVARLILKLGPGAEHVAWVSTLMLAVVVPALSPLRRLLASLDSLRGSSGHASIVFAAAEEAEPGLGGAHVFPAGFVLALILLYGGALLYFALRLAWRMYCTSALVRDAEPASLTAQQQETWSECNRSFCVDAARVLATPRVNGPVTLGLLEPVLLVPTEFAMSCAPQEFLVAVAHECAHMKRHDFQKNLFYEAASLVVAFHPAIWFINSHIAQTREMICDGMATERLIDSRRYIQSLLRLASMIAAPSRVSTSHAIGIFDADILEKRIMTMNIKRHQAGAALKYGLIIPATLLLLSVAAAAAEMAVEIVPQSPAQAASQPKPYGHVYRVGNDVSAPVPLHIVLAKFPKSELAGSGGFNGGICLVGIVVDASGMPRDAHVARSLRPDFDANAINAVQQYRFLPAKRLGKPVAVSVNVEVNFKRY
ncbi:MAG TPA: M56 family metallopeptidase [Terracidiphilus sp.]|nr:M56 family metallopeptidase [Terracidiphilus sp.]